MIQIDLQQSPNQNFKFQVGEEFYNITIKSIEEATFISISRDDVVLISNQIIIPNRTIIMYDYLTTNGNFIFQTNNNNLADYTRFNQTQFLYYVTLEELESIDG